MEHYNVVAIDLAKRIFHIVCLDNSGKAVVYKQLQRKQVLSYCKKHFKPGQRIAMEACGGSHFWSRTLTNEGFEVILLKPYDVKPYSKSRQKNDTNDALGIAKAANDPELRHVQPKNIKQQELATFHHLRQDAIRSRIRKTNQILGILHEFGYIGDGRKKGHTHLADFIETAYQEGYLPELIHKQLLKEYETIEAFVTKEEEISAYLKQQCKHDERAKLLDTIPGMGDIVSTIMGTLPIESYPTAKDFAASLGLVPSQNSTGGKIVLGKITKRGNRYVRKMLVQGASSVLRGIDKKQDRDALHKWASRKYLEKGPNTATVALANKLARIAYGCIINNKPYEAR